MKCVYINANILVTNIHLPEKISQLIEKMCKRFLLSMEYLSRLLKNLKWNRELKYHPKCLMVNIVLLGFADYLLLFIRDND